MQVNMLLGKRVAYLTLGLIKYKVQFIFLGLFLDVVFVGVIKAYVRRRRPAANVDDAIAERGPDKFSFPSGHASRAVFVTFFFINLYPLSIIFMPPLLAWSTSICLSRILMNRHHILDVVAGVLLGLFEGLFLSLIWLDDSTAKWIISFLSDEKLDGGEFHV